MTAWASSISGPGRWSALSAASANRRAWDILSQAIRSSLIDLAAFRQTQGWPTPGLAANFPMALDGSGRELWVAFRQPATIAAYNAQTGTRLAAAGTCADADDVLLDARRSRLYLSCGEGQIDVLEWHAPTLRPVARIATRRGARTALFAAKADRLYLAVPATGQQPAAIWVYRPVQ
jgi:hypothetical protein